MFFDAADTLIRFAKADAGAPPFLSSLSHSQLEDVILSLKSHKGAEVAKAAGWLLDAFVKAGPPKMVFGHPNPNFQGGGGEVSIPHMRALVASDPFLARAHQSMLSKNPKLSEGHAMQVLHASHVAGDSTMEHKYHNALPHDGGGPASSMKFASPDHEHEWHSSMVTHLGNAVSLGQRMGQDTSVLTNMIIGHADRMNELHPSTAARVKELNSTKSLSKAGPPKMVFGHPNPNFQGGSSQSLSAEHLPEIQGPRVRSGHLDNRYKSNRDAQAAWASRIKNGPSHEPGTPGRHAELHSVVEGMGGPHAGEARKNLFVAARLLHAFKDTPHEAITSMVADRHTDAASAAQRALLNPSPAPRMSGQDMITEHGGKDYVARIMSDGSTHAEHLKDGGHSMVSDTSLRDAVHETAQKTGTTNYYGSKL